MGLRQPSEKSPEWKLGVFLWYIILGMKDPFDELWDERKSSPDFDLEGLSDDEIPDYDGMNDEDEY